MEGTLVKRPFNYEESLHYSKECKDRVEGLVYTKGGDFIVRWFPIENGTLLGYSDTVKAGDIIQQTLTPDGYKRVSLNVNSKTKWYFVHRLVCLAFYGEPPTSEYEVNHKYGVKTNNYYKDLEWCTHLENMQHSYVTGLNTYFDLIPILVWDIIEDPNQLNIKEYGSVNEMYRDVVDVTWEGIRSNLLNSKILYLKRYFIIVKSNFTTWPPLYDIYVDNNIVAAKNMNTSEIFYGTSMKDLAVKINVAPTVVYLSFKKNIKQSHYIWLYAYGRHEINWSKLENEYNDIYGDIVVFNTINRTVYIVHNIQELTKILPISRYIVEVTLRDFKYMYNEYVIFKIHDTSEFLQKIKGQYEINI